MTPPTPLGPSRVMDGPSVRASVIIATHNRKEELQVAIASAMTQTEPAELIVIDDGSTDGTADMMAAQFPQVRLIRHEVARGCIVRRNEAAALASAPIVFSIDDDAAFSTPEVVRQTLQEFDSPRIGAVAIPYIDVRKGPELRQCAPDTGAVYCTETFIGTAHAVRREVFLSVGGYREALVHQGEEGDVCLRMLDAGFVVRLGSADPIHHFESPIRDFRKMDHYGAHNAVLFAWQNVPMPFVLVHLPGTALKCLLYTLQPKRLKTRLMAIVKGIADCRRHPRAPVSTAAYRLFRRLRTHRPMPLTEVEPYLRASARQATPIMVR